MRGAVFGGAAQLARGTPLLRAPRVAALSHIETLSEEMPEAAHGARRARQSPRGRIAARSTSAAPQGAASSYHDFRGSDRAVNQPIAGTGAWADGPGVRLAGLRFVEQTKCDDLNDKTASKPQSGGRDGHRRHSAALPTTECPARPLFFGAREVEPTPTLRAATPRPYEASPAITSNSSERILAVAPQTVFCP